MQLLPMIWSKLQPPVINQTCWISGLVGWRQGSFPSCLCQASPHPYYVLPILVNALSWITRHDQIESSWKRWCDPTLSSSHQKETTRLRMVMMVRGCPSMSWRFLVVVWLVQRAMQAEVGEVKLDRHLAKKVGVTYGLARCLSTWVPDRGKRQHVSSIHFLQIHPLSGFPW